MSARLPTDTRNLYQKDPGSFTSRSLFMDRLAVPDARDRGRGTERKDWFDTLIRLNPVNLPKRNLFTNKEPDSVLYAKLQSRMMVNMAGGVMENAGLCLDRFGLPYIPGSAVKGCARRSAIYELSEASNIEAKVELLTSIAMVFGWGDNEWKPGRGGIKNTPKSDFWWAMAQGETEADSERNEIWDDVRQMVLSRLQSSFSKVNGASEAIPSFGGTVSFFAALPVKTTMRGVEYGKLELDVLTCHHGDYYQSPDRDKIALDDEDPVPVFFPAVAAGHVFEFNMIPIRKVGEDYLSLARKWLADGLSIFGMGAKTNAGYGWFDSSEEFDADFREQLQEETRLNLKQVEAERVRKAKEEEDKKEQEKKKEEKEKVAKMSPEERAEYEIAKLDKVGVLNLLSKFEKKGIGDEELMMQAMVKAFRRQESEEKCLREIWDEIKTKSSKGKKDFIKKENFIREFSYKYLGRPEGKMP